MKASKPMDIKPLAKVIAWTVNNSLLIRREDLHQTVLMSGIPPICEPKELRQRAKFQRTLKTISHEELKLLAQEGVFHPVLENDEKSVWLWVTHEIDQTEKVTFTVERKFTYHKDLGFVSADDPDRLIELREILRLLPMGSPEKSVIFSEISSLESQVRETQKRLDELMQHFSEVLLPSDIRAFLTRCVDIASGIPMRQRGGVYIVPNQSFEIVESMKEFLTLIDPSGSSMLKIINILDVPKLTDQLRALAESLGITSDDLFSVLDLAKQELDNRDDIQAIFSSFEDHFFGEIDDIAEELSKFRSEGRVTRDGTIMDRMQQLNGLMEQTEMFAKLLNFKSREYVSRIGEIQTDLEKYVSENDQRRSERKKEKVR